MAFDSEQKLVEYNVNGIMKGLISAEEHLADQERDGLLEHDSWCVQKHLRWSTHGHHAQELISHAKSVDPELSKKVAEWSNKLEETAKNPSLEKVRALRNEFREIINDPTLGGKSCGYKSICAHDVYGAKNLNTEKTTKESSEHNTHFYANNSNNENRGEQMTGFKGAGEVFIDGLYLIGGRAADTYLAAPLGARLPSLGPVPGKAIAQTALGLAVGIGGPMLIKNQAGKRASQLIGAYLMAQGVAEVINGFSPGLLASRASYARPRMRIGLSPSEQFAGTPMLGGEAPSYKQELVTVD